MQIIQNLDKFNPEWESSVITLGIFDGIHLGHQALLKMLQKKKDSFARVLVTYYPHPDIVLGKIKNEYATELFTYDEKLSLLQKYNIDIDAVIFLNFTKELASTSADEYLKRILIDKIKAKHIVIGYDQCFGKNREGNHEFLLKKSSVYNFTVERIEPILYENEIVSSSKIKVLLKEGNIELANKMLGKYFFITGTVVKGFQRGRLIGFPTANLSIPITKVIPKIGVYRGYCEYGGKFYKAMINIGYNPTFNNQLLSVEGHILDFEQNIYGEQIKFHFESRLREEIKFKGIDELKKQLEIDRESTKTLPDCYLCF